MYTLPLESKVVEMRFPHSFLARFINLNDFQIRPKVKLNSYRYHGLRHFFTVYPAIRILLRTTRMETTAKEYTNYNFVTK